MAILVIKEESGLERRADVRPLPFRIGKKTGHNALVLEHIGISREHCVISKEDDGFAIADSDSRNGTYLNGRRLAGPEPLHDRDAIRVGPFTLTFFERAPSFAEATEGKPSFPKASASADSSSPAGAAELRRAGAAADKPAMADKSAGKPSFARASASAQAMADKPAAAAKFAREAKSASAGKPAASAAPVHHTPVELKKKVHEEVLATLDLKHSDLTEKSAEEVHAKATAAARAAVRKFDSERPAWLAAEALVKEVVDEAVGLGPLEDFLADDSVDEIMVNGWEHLYIERHGKIVLTEKQFTSNEQVLAVIRRILAPIGRRVDELSVVRCQSSVVSWPG